VGRFEILSMNIGFLFFQVINAHQLDLSFLILNIFLSGLNLPSLGFDLSLPGLRSPSVWPQWRCASAHFQLLSGRL